MASEDKNENVLRFEIRSSNNGTHRIKGYRVKDFAKPFERFRIGEPLGRSGKGKQ
jgi:hypothetical protein